MDAREKATEINDLLRKAWLLAYNAELESKGEERKLFDEIGMAINRAKVECDSLLKTK